MTFLLCAKKVRGKRPFKTQEYYNIMPKNRAIYYVDNLHKTILSYSVYKSKGDKRRLVSPYKLTKYRLHLFSPVLFKSPLPAIADNSLCKVFSPQSIKDPIALILMSVIVAPFLNSLMTVMISARLCSLNFSKLNWMLFLVRTKNNIQFNFEKLREQRRADIITVIKEFKNGATITDIKIKAIGSLIDCGEKTLQRELSAMAGSGLLKRTGEKRWSRYFVSL